MKLTKLKWPSLLFLIVILVAFPFLVRNNYIQHIAITCLIYACLALSLNIIIGLSGQFSLGHVTFYGIGAYTTALMMMRLSVNFWLALLCGALLSGIIGALLAIPTLKLHGDYVAVVTLGFGEVFRLFITNAVKLTRGPMGIPGIKSPSIFGLVINSKIEYYFLFLIVTAIVVFFIHRMLKSGFGLTVLAMNSDPIAAAAIGIYPVKFKLTTFTAGAVIAGLMGGLFAVYLSFIGPTNFAYAESISMVSMVVLGGLGSVIGSVAGAIILTLLPELLRAINDYRLMIFGAVMIIMMIFRPNGIWGLDRREKNSLLKGGHIDAGT